MKLAKYRYSDGTIGKCAQIEAAQKVLAERLAKYDQSRAKRTTGDHPSHQRHIRAAERLGAALSLAGHCPYDQTARLRKYGTTNPIEIARKVCEERS